MRFQRVQIDLNDLVVLGTFIGNQVVLERFSQVGDFTTLGSAQVISHALVEGEQRGGGTDFGTHVANRGHTRARDTIHTRSKVLHDSTGSTLDREDAGDLHVRSDLYGQRTNLQDDVLGRSPSTQFSSELDTNDLGALDFPRNVGHDIDRIGTTHTNGNHTEATGVRSMTIGTDHQTTRESVVFQDNLMDNTTARLPEADSVLCGGSLQELIDFLVDVLLRRGEEKCGRRSRVGVAEM